ncbi:amidohydrolase family protein [Streptomyces sp. SID8379]|uniref:amidohydrolase family protein n=1 Tax=unclassified Streptomyces TaxID=2593676 RepID=UPI000372AA52|nr:MULTISPECIES: amidohydrolase family protein [unclassified Streptomyces]MYW62609.1 amidohydrolase family protein [Streptomyces sp. SID8379]
MPTRPAPLLLRSATVVDTRDGTRSPGTDVLVQDGTITAVGRGLGAPDGTTTVDAHDHYVVPGYNDMHAHPLGRGEPSATLELMLAHGITGFRQMHGDLDLLRARAAGTLALPEASPALLALPGPLLTMLNTATADEAAATVREQAAAGADFVKSAAMTKERFFDAQAEALRLGIPIVGHLPGGIDVLKASRIGMKSIEHFGSGLGVLACCSTEEHAIQEAAGARQRLNLPKVRLPFMDRVVDKAVEAVMKRVVLNPVALNKPEDIALVDQAVRTYAQERTRALADRFAQDGTWHVPTLIRQKTSKLCDVPGFAADPDLRFMAPATRKTWHGAARRFTKRFTPEQRAVLAASHRHEYEMARVFDAAGVRMLVGTDSSGAVWVVPGAALHDEIDLLAEAGLAPLRLLRMLTLDAAEFLGTTDTMGTVEPGRAADLVLLAADPVTDAAHLHSVAGVVRAGRHYPAPELTRMKDRLATAGTVH